MCHITEEHEQQVNLNAPLMDLVQDNVADRVQGRVAQQSPQKDTCQSHMSQGNHACLRAINES